MAGLSDILKIDNDGSLLNTWHFNVVSALESFFSSINTLVQQQKLPLSPIAISYAQSISGTDECETLAQLLASCFNQLGISVNLCPLVDENTLRTQLNGAGYSIVLCTPQYADKVGKSSPIWSVLDAFGKTKKNALHPLLCEGGFADTALKIVDGHYLIRSFQSVLNKDPLVALPALVEFVFHLSGSQGLGLLPDILNLKETVNAEAESSYRRSFSQLQLTLQKQTINYRLKSALEEGAQHHPMKPHVASSPFPVVKEVAGVAPILQGFLQSEAKVGLLFCQSKADTALTSLALTEMFAKSTTPVLSQGAAYVLTQSATRVLTIDCAQYPGTASWDCVKKALKALKLKTADIEVMKKEPLIIIFNGYQDLGAYDNLWVKNTLSTWANIKLFVTCQADFFKERGYLRCFLADVSNRRVEDIAVFSIPTFASLDAQMAALSITVTPDVNQEAEQYPISDKRKAEYVELTRFLGRLHQLWVEKDYLKSALHQNPRLFISYAWEEDKTDAGKKALARQQMYLSRIAQDFKTIGIPTWLDTEQMSGNINEQMEKNIAESHGVLVIETQRYIERSQQDTNVKKEWDAIESRLKLQSQLQSQEQSNFSIFPIQYSSHVTQGNPTVNPHQASIQTSIIASFLANHTNRCDFTNVDDDYVSRMTHPDIGLIPRWLCDTPEKKEIYQNAYAKFEQELQLLVGKHLVVNQAQSDVLAFDMSNRLKRHIAPFGLYTEDSAMDTRFNLVKHFEDFLNKPECKTAIVLGRAGSGKSLFALSTFRQLLQPWLTYQSTNQEKPRWLPIYIQLRNYPQHPENAIQDALKQQFRLTDTDIAALKQGLNHQQQILFILDGYDELGSGVRPNYTETLKDWAHAKLLITSRPEHFDKDHRPLESLALTTVDGKILFNSVQEVYVSPFASNEIEQYVKNYEEGKNTDTYQTLKDLPGMMVLLDNPFLLTLVLQALPQLLKNRVQSQERSIVRADIYEAFTQTWFLQETNGRALNPKDCERFSEELAFRLFANKTISVSDTKEKKDLWTFFNHPDNQTPQEASPVQLSGGEYGFVHKSIYEYFVAKRLWRAIPETDCIHLWQTRLLTEERPIIDFLGEIYLSSQARTDNEARLFTLVESSKDKTFPAIASSNAITILNQARVRFNSKDFRGIQIPGADLSGAICDNTNFEGANLTNVSLTGAWLHGTNFNQALMAGLQLGEYPSIILESMIHSCCYSPDALLLAMGTNKDIYLYNTQTRALVRTLKGHTDSVKSISFSPDGQCLASGSNDKTVKIWQVDSGALLKTLEDHSWVNSVAFSPDGQCLTSGSHDNTVKIWQVESGALLKTLEGHTNVVFSVAFSPDGQCLASGSKDHTVKLWQVESGALLKTLQDHTWPWHIYSVAFSPDGQCLATAEDKTVKLWQVDTGALLKTFKGHAKEVNKVAFSPDGQRLASGSNDNSVKLWQVESGALLKTFEGHTDKVFSVAFSPDGQRLASGSWDKTTKLWEVESKSYLQILEGHTDNIISVAFSPDGQCLASGSKDHAVKLWQADSGALLKTLKGGGYGGGVHSVAFSPNGQCLALGGNWSSISLWQVENSTRLKNLGGCTGFALSVAFSPNGQMLASGSGGGRGIDDRNFELMLWDVESGALLKTLKGYTNHVSSVAFSPDGQRLASGSWDETVKLWDVESGTLLKTFEGHAENVRSVAFSPNGQCLASASRDKTVKLWQVESGALLKTFEGHTDEVSSVVFSPDGQRLASASDDCTLRLWNNLDGLKTPRSFITQATSAINSLSFHANPKGTFLASGHSDHSVRMWQLMTLDNTAYLQLLWTTHQNALLSQNANIQNVQGLSIDNRDLLTQRGANKQHWKLAIAEIPATSSASLSSVTNEMANLKLFSDGAKSASGSGGSSSRDKGKEKEKTKQLKHEKTYGDDERKKKCVIS